MVEVFISRPVVEIASSTNAGAGLGTVTSVDVVGGTTGLTTSGGPITTNGTITLDGILAVAHGGTGTTTYTPGHAIFDNYIPVTNRSNLNFRIGFDVVDDDPDIRIDLGGTLDGSINYDGAQTHSIEFNNLNIFSAQALVGSNTTSIGMNPTTLGLYSQTGAQSVAINLDVATFQITDGRTVPKGIEYAADYSAGYTNRSLIDKGYGDGAYWKLVSGGTLIGVNTITSNTANQLNFTGTWTATANNQYMASFGGSITARTTASDFVYGYLFNPSLTGGASNIQNVVGVGINPTITGGADNTDFGVGLYINPTYSGTFSDLFGLVVAATPSGSTNYRMRIMNSGSGSAHLEMVANPGADLTTGISRFVITRANGVNGSTTFTNTGGGVVDWTLNSSNTLRISNATLAVGSQSALGRFYVLQAALSSQWIPAVRIDPGAHTSMTASTEFIGSFLNITAATQQWSTGALALQRFNFFGAPTIAFVGASTATTVHNIYIESPVAGTNATITNNYALGVQGVSRFEQSVNSLNNIQIVPLGGAANYIQFSTPTAVDFRIGAQSAGAGTMIWMNKYLQLPTGIYISTSGATADTAAPNITRSGTSGAGNFIFTSNSSQFVQNALSSGWVPAVRIDPGAHTSMTAGTEFIGSFINVTAATQQWSTGALATQRFNYFGAPTIAFTTASTATDVYNVYVEAPVAGTNATITNNWALGVNGNVSVTGDIIKPSGTFVVRAGSGNIQVYGTGSATYGSTGANSVNLVTSNVTRLQLFLSGDISVGGGTDVARFSINQLALGSAWTPAFRIDSAAHINMTAGTEFLSFDYRGATQTWNTGALALQRFTYFKSFTIAFNGASTVTDAYSVYIDPPIAGTNATITNAYALGVAGNVRTSGSILHGATMTDTPTANTRLDVRGTGTTTNLALRIADSSNAVRVTISDQGQTNFNAVAAVGTIYHGFQVGGITALAVVADGSTGFGQGQDHRIGRATDALSYNVAGSSNVFYHILNEDITQYGYYFHIYAAQTHTTGSTRQYFMMDGNTLTSASGTVAAKHLTLKSTFNVQGTGQLTYVSAEPTFTDYDGAVTGFDWNPTTPANIAGTHIAYRATSGNVLFGGTTLTSGDVLVDLQSSSRALVITRIAGDVANPVDGMINYNSSTNKFRFRENGAWVGVGTGITNSASADELMKSDGTNAIPSGLFSTTDGWLDMGSSGLAGSNRRTTAVGSASDITLDFLTKGLGIFNVTLGTGGNAFQLRPGNNEGILMQRNYSGTNDVNVMLSLQRNTSGTAAVGIGLAIEMQIENASGTLKIGNTISSVATNVTAGTEAFDTVFKNMNAGAAAAERFRIASTAVLSLVDVTTVPSGNPSGADYIWKDTTYHHLAIKTPQGNTFDLTAGSFGRALMLPYAMN